MCSILLGFRMTSSDYSMRSTLQIEKSHSRMDGTTICRLCFRRTIRQKAPAKRKKSIFWASFFFAKRLHMTLFPSLSSRRRCASLAEGLQNGIIEDSDVRMWSLFVLGFDGVSTYHKASP